MDNHINQNCKILNKPTRIYHLSETFIIFAKNTITRLIYILMETNNEQEKKRQNYQKEIERLVEAGKKLMAEANEIIGALPETQKGSIAMNNKKNQPKIPKNHPAESPACHAQQDSQHRKGKAPIWAFGETYAPCSWATKQARCFGTVMSLQQTSQTISTQTRSMTTSMTQSTISNKALSTIISKKRRSIETTKRKFN